MDERIGVVGLGYVGLPVALAFAKKFPGTIGFDINREKVEELKNKVDRTSEISFEALHETTLRVTSNPDDLAGCTFFVVAVPTPVDQTHQPDLTPLISASEIVGKALRPGAVIVYESTVYPGLTEDLCGNVLAQHSGLKLGVDFKLGYSPERINPGDKEHTLERIVKVVSGQDEETLERVAKAYEAIVDAGVYRASSIKVAEAAKVIENTQRDLNIALMNELALIFDRIGIRTKDVLDAANTKWNFLRFTPGLVGGHCIGVDPYYLTTKADEVGYHPQVILAGRRINDNMGTFIAQKMIKLMRQADLPLRGARIGILGLTFKENIPDLRNSRVPDIIRELREFGIDPLVHDPLANQEEAREHYDIELLDWANMKDLDGIILAVNHQSYLEKIPANLLSLMRADGVLLDVKSVVDPASVPETVLYWSL